MGQPGGWSIIGISIAVILVAWFGVRRTAPPWLADLGSVVGGAGLGMGGLLLLHDVGVASWVLTPVGLAAATVVHRRLLFAGDGPLRT